LAAGVAGKIPGYLRRALKKIINAIVKFAQQPCSGPSSAGRTCFSEDRCDLFVLGELARARLGEALLDGRALLVRHLVNSGAARLDLARVFGKLILVLLSYSVDSHRICRPVIG
jgi:hypothetical protein